MAQLRGKPTTNTGGTNIADLLERVLDKGIVVAGDVKVKLVDIELLTIQIRLVVCSIDKAKEMGMDWWANSPIFNNDKPKAAELEGKPETSELEERVRVLSERIRELESEAPAPAMPIAQIGEEPPQEPRRFRPIPIV